MRSELLRMTALRLVCALGALSSSFAIAQSAPKMKMTTDIPPEITTPDSVETRIGTFKFFDGFPDDRTTQLVYDNLDFMAARISRCKLGTNIPGNGWNMLFRLYGPLDPWFDKTWRVGEVELVQ